MINSDEDASSVEDKSVNQSPKLDSRKKFFRSSHEKVVRDLSKSGILIEQKKNTNIVVSFLNSKNINFHRLRKKILNTFN